MRELARLGDVSFVTFDEPSDVDRVQIRSVETHADGFEFFRGLGIVGYERTFRTWLRHFPRPVFLAAVRGRALVAWMFMEEHGDVARDGSPVHVLRAIETLPELRGRRLGLRLLLLGLEGVAGHVVTKPLTKEARAFFVRAGFTDLAAEGHPPVDPRSFPGYLVMPTGRRREVVSRLRDYFPSPDGAGGESRGGPGRAPPR